MKRVNFLKSLGVLFVIPFLPKRILSLDKSLNEDWVNLLDKWNRESLEIGQDIEYRIISIKNRLVEVLMDEEWFSMEVVEYKPKVSKSGNLTFGPEIKFTYLTNKRPKSYKTYKTDEERMIHIEGLEQHSL